MNQSFYQKLIAQWLPHRGSVADLNRIDGPFKKMKTNPFCHLISVFMNVKFNSFQVCRLDFALYFNKFHLSQTQSLLEGTVFFVYSNSSSVYPFYEGIFSYSRKHYRISL